MKKEELRKMATDEIENQLKKFPDGVDLPFNRVRVKLLIPWTRRNKVETNEM